MSDEIRKQVRKEKAAYESQVEEDLEETKEEIAKSVDLVPLGDTGHQSVNRLMREYYDDETLEHLQLARCKVKALSNALRTLSKNIIKYSTPIMCQGPKCPMVKKCPIFKAAVAPIGRSCPIELMLIDQWEKEYMDDLGIDTQSKVEMDLVRDMIESDIMDWRTSHELANKGLFDWNTVGVSQDGKPIIRKEENAAISIKLKFKGRKDKLREDLMATRKIRAKFGLNKTVDPSKLAANLNDRYKEIKEAHFTEAADDKLEMPKGRMDVED